MSFTKRLRSTFLGRAFANHLVRRWQHFFSPGEGTSPFGGFNNSQAVAFGNDVPERLPPCDILVQVENFEAGGLENVVIDLNNTFLQAGYRVVLLVLGSQGAAVNRATDLGHTVICHIYSHDTYAALIDKLQPKLVLAHYSVQGVALCHQKGIPFVQVIHNIYMWFNDRQRREFADMAVMTTAFVAVSEYVKSYSASRLGVEAEKCIVISNGIDFEPFKAGDDHAARIRLRSEYGIADKDFVFLDVGAINHQKNHLGMVKAFEIAARTCTNTRLAILGPCYEAGLLREIFAYIERQGLEKKVIYCGSAPGVHEHMAMADAFVSATFFEGGPLTLLEAIVADVPVVMPAVGCAYHFAGKRGIKLIDPVFDMIEFSAPISEMKSTSEFEQRLADAMVETWNNPVRPGFLADELAVLERGRAYANYLHLVSDVIEGKFIADRKPVRQA